MTDLPPGWEWTTLGEVLDKVDVGRSFGATKHPARPGKWGIVRVSAMTYGAFRPGENKEIDPGAKPNLYHQINLGDILVSRANTSNYVGAAVQVEEQPEKLLLSDKSLRLVPSEAVSRRFLLHYLTSPQYRSYISASATGTKDSMRNVSQDKLRSTPFPLPPIAEQNRLVDEIEALRSFTSSGRSSVDRASHTMAKLRTRLIDAAVSGTPGRYVTTEDVLAAPLANGRSVPTRTGGFPVLRLTALGETQVDLSEHKEGDWSIEDARPHLVKEGDFLLSRGNGSVNLVGRGALVGYVKNAVAFPDTIIRMRAHTGLVLPDFLALTWKSTSVRRQIEMRAKTTAGIHKISQSDVRSITFTVPSLRDQHAVLGEVRQALDSLERLHGTVRTAQTRGRTLNSAILARAFAGELTHQDPCDEPASLLLDRVRAERAAAPAARRRSPRSSTR